MVERNINKVLLKEIENVILDGKLTNENILKKLDKILNSDDVKPRTLSLRYSVAKKIYLTKRKDPDIEFSKKIKPDDNITSEIIKVNQEIRDNKRQLLIPAKLIKDIIKLKKSDDLRDIYIYILLISGRRFSDIFDNALPETSSDIVKYSKDPSNKNNIVVIGLKKRDKSLCKFKALTNRSDFFKILKKINIGLNSSKLAFRKSLALHIEKLGKRNNLSFKLTPHMMRGIYAVYIWTFRNDGNFKINTSIQNSLCHVSINSSNSYTGMVMDFKKDLLRK